MKCSKAELLISIEADGEITVQERMELDAHIAQCESCGVERRSVHALRNVLTEWETPAPSDTLAEAFAHRLRQEQERRQTGWTQRLLPRWPVYAFASTAAIAAAALIVTVVHQPQAPVAQAPPVQVAQGLAEAEKPVPAAAEPEQISAASEPQVELDQVATAPQPVTAVVEPARTPRPVKRQPTKVAVARAYDPPSPKINSLAIAPGAASAAVELANSARTEAEERVAEKALRLRTLMAEADYTIERALISPVAHSREISTQVDTDTSGISI